jgi:hypothetical protein
MMMVMVMKKMTTMKNNQKQNQYDNGHLWHLNRDGD